LSIVENVINLKKIMQGKIFLSANLKSFNKHFRYKKGEISSIDFAKYYLN